MKGKMRLKNVTLMTVAAAVLYAINATAQPSTYPTAKAAQVYHYMAAPSPRLFNSQELSIDIGPSYTTTEDRTIFSAGGGKGVWGVDGAVTYWVKQYAGFGIDGGIVNTKQNNDLVFSHLDATASGRIPLYLLSDSFPFRNTAVVGKAAFGKDFRNGDYATTLGAGLNFRLTQHVGVVGMYQHVWETDRGNNENQILAALQVAF